MTEELVDLYLAKVEARNKLDKEIKELKDGLSLGKGRYFDKLEVVEVPSYTYDTEKAYKLLGGKRFREFVTVTKAALVKANLSEEQINKLVSKVEIQLRYMKYDEEKEKKYSKKNTENS